MFHRLRKAFDRVRHDELIRLLYRWNDEKGIRMTGNLFWKQKTVVKVDVVSTSRV